MPDLTIALLRQKAFNLSPEDQHTLATVIAANVGYKLVADDHVGDCITLASLDHRIKDVSDRLIKVETRMREAVPHV